jgi:hypothetical protein
MANRRMHCRHYERQTKGEVNEIELDGLTCRQAAHCRRKGICALSPFSYPELVRGRKQGKGEEAETEVAEVDGPGVYFEVLRFKNALGFQWHRVDDFTTAVDSAERFAERGQPRYIRRVEIFQLPDE